MSKGEESHGSKSPWAFRVPLIASALFVLGGAVILVLGLLLTRTSPSLGLDKLGVTGDCAMKTGATLQLSSIHLYAAQMRWSALFLLMVLVSGAALAIAVATVVSIWRENRQGRYSATRKDIVVLTAAVAVAIVVQTVMTRPPTLDAGGVTLSARPAFLSYLMTTFTATFGGGTGACQELLKLIWLTKRVGETIGIVVGAAMTATAAAVSDRARLADRILAARQLLYAGSLLFVVGLLMTQANFAWIAATWSFIGDNDRTTKEIADLISAGVLQVGVAYTAILATFFIPARWYLSWQVAQSLPHGAHDREARKGALEDLGITASWADEAKQILALLAPVVSAPILDALTKSH